MTELEAYKKSSTCGCGGMPGISWSKGKMRVRCRVCGCAGPLGSNPEIAVRNWNVNVEALTSKLSVLDIVERDNPKLAEIMSR